MLVKILLFARLRDITGTADLERQLPDASTAQTAWNALAAEFPALAEYEGTVSCAVNEEYARFTTALRDGDEVAFLPPVSGGEEMLDNSQRPIPNPQPARSETGDMGTWDLEIGSWKLTADRVQNSRVF